MSWEAVQDLRKRRKDVEFWTNITPDIVPFNNPLFNELSPQLKKTQRSVCEFSANKKQTKNGVFRNVLHDKETQTSFYNTIVEKSDKTTQTQFNCTCLDTNLQKFDGLALTGISEPEGDVVKISQDLPFKINVVRKFKPDSKLRLTDVQHSKSCEFSEQTKIKSCYVLVEKLHLEKETSNTAKQTTATLYSMDTEYDIALDSLTAGGHCSKELPLRNDEKLKMIPRVFLRRVGESVDFLKCLDLRPKWKNTDIFHSPARLRKLGRSRSQVR